MLGKRLKDRLGDPVAVLASCIFALAAVTARPATAAEINYRFQSPFIEGDATVAAIQHIAQDDRGFIWLAQRRSLRRFDAVSLTKIEKPSDQIITAIATDRRGGVWLGTEIGLLRWTQEDGVALPVDLSEFGIQSDADVGAMAVDSKGQLWLSTSEGLVLRYDVERASGTLIADRSSDEAESARLVVTEILPTGRGYVWMLRSDATLHRHELDSGVTEPVDLSLAEGQYTTLVEGVENDVILGTARGDIVRVHETTLEQSLVASGAPPINALAVDPQGHLWVGTSRGLKILGPGLDTLQSVLSNPEAPTEPSTDPVHALFLDRSEVLWIASGAGNIATTSTNASAFGHWRIEDDGASAPIMSITEGPDGSLWAGTYQSGLFRRYPSGALRHFGAGQARDVDTTPLALLVDRHDQLWIGTLNYGLTRMDPTTEEFIHYTSDSTGLKGYTITALAEAADGRILIGTVSAGLNILDPDTGLFDAYVHDGDDPTSLSENQIRSILEDSQGRLWLGTRRHGLNVMLPGRSGFIRLRSNPDDPRTLASDTVVSLAEDSRGQIWVGTYEGLHRLDIDGDEISMERFGAEQGLLGPRIFSIQEDGDGDLWLSTSRGISRLDVDSGVFVNLSRNHGLPPGGFNFGAAHVGTDGRFHFGSKYGVTTFVPADISLEPYAPPIVLTGVAKMGRDTDIPLSGEMVLRHVDSVISFNFSLLDFVAPSRNRYEHLLEGFDDEWINQGNHQRATYSNLPPGSYTFRVRGANSEGVWSAVDATMAIRVLPPPWATWWAYSLYALMACALVMTYVRHQARKQRQEALYTQRLEREVHRRTRELAEQNEKLRYANELLEVASVTDSLTGVRNRRFLLTTIDQDIALVDRAFATMSDESRQDSAFVFILFDLDGFKEINDSFGHSAGDLVLFQVRDLLNQACRSSDTLIRWGGDEFLIVAREATRAHVEALAERIRQSVADHLFDIGTSVPVQLTCSLGFACYPFVATNPRLYSWEEVIDIADRALYIAKRHGPNMWAGIFGTEHTEETPAEDLLVMIMERPELLGAEGSIRLVTSRPTPTQTELHPSSSGSQRAS